MQKKHLISPIAQACVTCMTSYLDPEFAGRGVWVDNNALNDAINAGMVG